MEKILFKGHDVYTVGEIADVIEKLVPSALQEESPNQKPNGQAP